MVNKFQTSYPSFELKPVAIGGIDLQESKIGAVDSMETIGFVGGTLRMPNRPLKSFLQRLLQALRRTPPPAPHDPASPHDPFSWKPAPLKPRPRRPAGSVAVAEPDEK